MKFDADAIAAATGGQVLAPCGPGEVLTDTRALRPGCWFLALKGERFDAHDFLASAAAAGAAGCIVSRAPEGWAGGVVLVADTTVALQDLGRAARAALTVPVVGLTGSAGKTTTRGLIACALAPLGEVHQTVGNLNNQLGVPMTLVATPPGAAALVVEMGTSSPGEIGFLVEIARPTVRLIVNVGPAHLLELGGLDGVAVEKGAMFATAKPGDVLCVNLDDERVRARPHPPGTRAIGWGKASEADIRLLSWRLRPSDLHTVAEYRTPEGDFTVDLPAPGEVIAHNAAGALAVAWALGVPLAAAAAGLTHYTPVGMRLKLEEVDGLRVINDAYNANPSSMRASLELLAALPGHRTAVLGDMLELGTEEAALHREIVAFAAGLGLDGLILLGPRMAVAADAAGGRASVADGPEEVALAIRQWLRPGDTVLLKGSRGARVEQVLHRLRGEGG